MSIIGRRKAEDELWFVHAPLKNEPRPLVQALPPSNIPYLNGVMDNEENTADQRKDLWFKESDSDYIKLAKMGGRHDLLVHKNTPAKSASKEPVGYPRPAWWVDMLTYNGLNQQDDQKNKEPYTFKVPAWFAHSDKVNVANLNTPPETNPYKNIKYIPRDYEKIEEPRKYGQLRNYIHPVKVTNPNAHQRPRPIPQYSSVEKFIKNDAEKEKPKDYQEWKSRQDPNLMRMSTKKSVGFH